MGQNLRAFGRSVNPISKVGAPVPEPPPQCRPRYLDPDTSEPIVWHLGPLLLPRTPSATPQLKTSTGIQYGHILCSPPQARRFNCLQSAPHRDAVACTCMCTLACPPCTRPCIHPSPHMTIKFSISYG
eukprot:364212-Chlamydomonas_euryale.AAC.6